MSRMTSPGVRYEQRVLTLALRVQPGARQSGWAGTYGERLRLRISARAVDGQANKACVRFLAQSAGVAAGAVTILQGLSSRDKLVRVEGVTPEHYQALCAAWSQPAPQQGTAS